MNLCAPTHTAWASWYKCNIQIYRELITAPHLSYYCGEFRYPRHKGYAFREQLSRASEFANFKFWIAITCFVTTVAACHMSQGLGTVLGRKPCPEDKDDKIGMLQDTDTLFGQVNPNGNGLLPTWEFQMCMRRLTMNFDAVITNLSRSWLEAGVRIRFHSFF